MSFNNISEQKTYTYIIHNGKCDFKDQYPNENERVKVRLIDFHTREERKGFFYVECEKSNPDTYKYRVGEWKDKKWFPIYTETQQYGPNWFEKLFIDHRNIKHIHSIVEHYTLNEELKMRSIKDPKSEKMKQPRFRMMTNKLYLATAPPMSCKTNFMRDLSLHFAKRGKSSIIVFNPQYTHLIQYRLRCKAFVKELQKEAEKCRKVFPLNIFSVNELTIKKMGNSLESHTPTIIMCLGTSKQISKLNTLHDAASFKSSKSELNSPILIIDEADAVDSVTKINGNYVKKVEPLNGLKERAGLIMWVTATPMDILFREKIPGSNIYILDIPDCYRGVDDFKISPIPEGDKYSSKDEDDLFKTSPNLSGVIEDFSRHIPSVVRKYNFQLHPCILLVNIGSAINPHIKAAIKLKQEYPNMTFILDNGNGVSLSCPSLRGTIEIVDDEGNIKRSSQDENGFYHWKRILNSEVLLYLKRNANPKHIVIFAGKNADRGISHSCFDSTAISGTLPFWHLTHQYVVLGHNTAEPNIAQRERLCNAYDSRFKVNGIFEHDIHLVSYESETTKEASIKAWKKIIDYVTELKKRSGVQYSSDILPTISMYSEKFTRHPLTLNDAFHPLKTNEMKDGAMDISEYKFKDPIIRRPEDGSEIKSELWLEFERKEQKLNEEQKELNIPINKWIGIRIPSKGKWLEIYKDVVDYLKVRPNTPVGRGEIRNQCSALTDRRQLLDLQKKFMISENLINEGLVFRNIKTQLHPLYEYMYRK